MSTINPRVNLRVSLALAVALLFTPILQAEHWTALGPDGGDVRSLAFDPHNPDHLVMGTKAGKLFASSDGGATWTRGGRLGSDDYVLEKVVVDPSSRSMFVAAWSLNTFGGDVFRSRDGGKSWNALSGMHGKAVHAVTLSLSNPKVIVAGALDGVYRSTNGGDSWSRITPQGHAELKNIDSVAIDPKNPEVIYAGTSHLPWKTMDGGQTWNSIKKGMADDSDVFSIIIDPQNPSIVYASACSGIYKSENGGELFHKVQGMPFSARRTRVLEMDPNNSEIVYAGTTEGLWKTKDGGKNFRLMTSPLVVINDIFIDPRNPSRIMLATDRGGVLVSQDAGSSFTASNRGFTHRQVSSLLMDRKDKQTLYAGLLNDRESGGVFVSHDSGAHWKQMSAGLDGRDVFALRQTESGTLVAGTNRGVLMFNKGASSWQASKPLMGKNANYIADVAVGGNSWFAATPAGVFKSQNGGRMWQRVAAGGSKNFVVVGARQKVAAAASRNAAVVSIDGGARWNTARLPSFVTSVRDLAISPKNNVWLATREGMFRSSDAGRHWEHVMNGLPANNLNSIFYEDDNNRLLATSSGSGNVYESFDGGHSWRSAAEPGSTVRAVVSGSGRMFVTTAYDGIMARNEAGQTIASRSTRSGSER